MPGEPGWRFFGIPQRRMERHVTPRMEPEMLRNGMGIFLWIGLRIAPILI